MALEDILSSSYFGNTVEEYLIALGVFVLVNLIIFGFKKYVLYLLHQISVRTKTEYDDLIISIIKSIKYPFYLILSLYIASWFIVLPKEIGDGIYYLLLIAVLYYIVKIMQVSLDFFVKEYQKKQEVKEKGTPRALEYLARFGKVLLWLIALLVLLSNMGFNINTLIAGFGIAGLAIAFALQNILSDIFYFFTIYFDKPFVEGDFLIIGDDLGTVEKIGLKSTRLKTLRGEELVMSNHELINSRIHNFKKMNYRRIEFGFGITYETPIKKMKKIPEIVKKIIEKVPKTRVDRVHFKKFADFSLNYEVIYYLDSQDYNVYMDAQQEINLGIKKEFEKEKIEFAYPTYSIMKK